MKMKKSVFVLIGVLFAVLVFPGCGGKGDSAGEAMLARMDSLQKVADTKTRDYDDLSLFVNTLGGSLDSIAAQEDLLFASVNEGTTLSRGQIQERVDAFARLIERQKERIAALTDSLKNRKGGNMNAAQIEKLNGIVAFLNNQLSAKDAELKRIQGQLKSSKASIMQLKASVASLKETNTKLETKNEKLDKALTVQDEVVNECFVKIGSKKDLEAAGVLSKGGFLKKRKVNYSGFSSGGFQRVDIRRFTDAQFAAKKAKLLTPAPAGSYSLTKSGNGQWHLRISDPTAFWSVSNYCVIQTD